MSASGHRDNVGRFFAHTHTHSLGLSVPVFCVLHATKQQQQQQQDALACFCSFLGRRLQLRNGSPRTTVPKIVAAGMGCRIGIWARTFPFQVRRGRRRLLWQSFSTSSCCWCCWSARLLGRLVQLTWSWSKSNSESCLNATVWKKTKWVRCWLRFSRRARKEGDFAWNKSVMCWETPDRALVMGLRLQWLGCQNLHL